MTVRITHIGGPTAPIEVGEWRLLTDPTFDPPGRRYTFGWGSSSRKLTGPAITPADLGPIDAVLLSHDHHGDNLDTAAAPCSRLPVWSSPPPPGPTGSGATPAASSHGEHPAVGLGQAAHSGHRHPLPPRPTAQPPFVGEVIGFAPGWEGQAHGRLWTTGDTVLYDGHRQVADRLRVDTAPLHLGWSLVGAEHPGLHTPQRSGVAAPYGALRAIDSMDVHVLGGLGPRRFRRQYMPTASPVRWYGTC